MPWTLTLTLTLALTLTLTLTLPLPLIPEYRLKEPCIRNVSFGAIRSR